jgi:predicted MFS family arabinose efflux permease
MTLRSATFRRLLACYTLDEAGNWLGEVALALIVYDRTGSALATAALFVAARFVPALAAPPLLARLEGIGRPDLLRLLFLAEAATFALLAVMAQAGLVALVVAVAIVDGTLARAGRATIRAATAAEFRAPDDLRRANGALNVSFTAVAALGPALAGVVVAGLGTGTALWLDAASFFLVALIAPRIALARDGEAGAGWRERLGAGLAYMRRHAAVRGLLAGQAAAILFFSVVVPIEVVFVKHTLGGGAGDYGALLASWGAGMVAGAGVFAVARRVSLSALIVASTLLIGVSYALIGVSGSIVAACLASVLGGLGNGVQWVAVLNAVQAATVPEMQLRVMALYESVATAMPAVGFALGGAIAALFSPRAAYLVAAGGVLVTLLVGAAIVRQARRRDPVAVAATESISS